MLPLALALLLGAALAFQLLAGNEIDLPMAGPVRGGAPVDGRVAIQPPVALVDPGIARRAMFMPVLAEPKEAAAGQGQLGGYAVVGVVQVNAAIYAIVQGPGERTFRAAPGQRLGGWQLRSVTRDEVALSRGGERMQVRFGPGGPVTTASGKGEQ
jgi:hypothetical protein